MRVSASKLLLRTAIMLFGIALGGIQALSQTTYWVDDGGDDTNAGTSSGAPWKHISFALQQVSSGDTIKVMPGTYDVASNGEAYPYQAISGSLVLEGSESAQGSWPRIGGDVDSATVSEIFLVDATSSNVSNVQLSRLYFVGEDSSGKDAPAGVRVVADDGHSITDSGISECYFERSEMNASGSSGEPCISIDLGDAGDSSFVIDTTRVLATARGGIEIRPLPSENSTAFVVDVRDTEVKITGADTAMFGIRVGGGTGQAVGGYWVTADVRLDNVSIDSASVTTPGTHGIETGIDFQLFAADGKLLRMLGNQIAHSEVKGCSGDGIRLWVNSDNEAGSITNIVTELMSNYVHDNGDGNINDGDIGAGIRVRWGTPGSPWGEIGSNGYINVKSKSNMIVDNDIGVLYEGFDDESLQNGTFLNDTIAGNVGPAFRFNGTFGGAPGYAPAPSTMANMVVWGNNGGGSNAQYDGSAYWAPGSQTLLSYSCWMNLATYPTCAYPDGNNNVAVDPNFVNAGAGDYHVSPSGSACVIDQGYSSFTGLPRADFEGDDRTLDGLEDGGDEVDMGADEHDPG